MSWYGAALFSETKAPLSAGCSEESRVLKYLTLIMEKPCPMCRNGLQKVQFTQLNDSGKNEIGTLPCITSCCFPGLMLP